MNFLLLAVSLLTLERADLKLEIDADSKAVDPGRSVFLTLKLTGKAPFEVEPPDLRTRVVGFSLAEDFAEEPVTGDDGTVTKTVEWRLVPEPVSEVYKIKPFAVGSHVAGPVYFDNPPPRDPVTGGMEIDPRKDMPPLSWKLVGFVAAALVAAAAVFFLVYLAVKYLVRRVREHRMSPIERAWVELDRLIKKGLPGRGRYKDFYVELTMVVRRYVQRKYGIKAPNMTTEEFLREAKPSDELRRFLESADLVKFAGVEATPEMADDAIDGARRYLRSDDSSPKGDSK
jgi:hypothetical protein